METTHVDAVISQGFDTLINGYFEVITWGIVAFLVVSVAIVVVAILNSSKEY